MVTKYKMSTPAGLEEVSSGKGTWMKREIKEDTKSITKDKDKESSEDMVILK